MQPCVFIIFLRQQEKSSIPLQLCCCCILLSGQPKQFFGQNTKIEIKLAEKTYFGQNRIFCQNEFVRPKQYFWPDTTVSAIFTCFSSIFQSKIKDYTRSILAETASFGQKVCFCRIQNLTKAKITKQKLILAKIFCQNRTEMIFGCPLILPSPTEEIFSDPSPLSPFWCLIHRLSP